MPLIVPGFWPDTYWPDRMWPPDYWPEYGGFVPPVPPSGPALSGSGGGHIQTVVTKRPSRVREEELVLA